MKNVVYKAALLAGALIVSGEMAGATPVITPKCAANMRVKAVENGAGVYFNDRCDTAYVLPPVKGSIELAALAKNANLASCSTLANYRSIAKTLSQRLRQLVEGDAKPRPGLGGGMLGRIAAGDTADDSAQEEVVTDEMIRRLEQVEAIQAKIQKMLEPFQLMEGATAQLLYTVPMDELVASYQAANPSLRFERLRMSTAYLSFATLDPDPVQRLTAAITVQVPGLGSIPTRVGDAFKDEGGSAKIFGSSLSGQVRLSLAGACPYYDAGQDKIKEALTQKDIGAHLSANVQYSYELQAHRAYRASYNLSVLAKKIKTQSTSGGLFHTSTAVEMIDERDSSSWFKLDQDSDDSRVSYDDLSKSLKADLMQRVLDQISIATTGAPKVGLEDPGKPGPSGVSVAADGLKSACAHPYCQVGAVVLNVAQAIWGSSSSSSSFIQRYKDWATDEVSDRRMVSFQGSFSFTPVK